MIEALVEPIQIYLIFPKAIETFLYMLIIFQIWNHKPKLQWKDRPLVLKLFLMGMVGWLTYISLDIIIYVIAPLSMENAIAPTIIIGYTLEYPSLLWANILRDIGFFGASVIMWSYFICSFVIRFGESRTTRFLFEHKVYYILITILTVFFVAYDMIQVSINESGVSVNAVFNGVSLFSLVLYISMYALAAFLMYRAFIIERNSNKSSSSLPHSAANKNPELRNIGLGVILMALGNTYWIVLGVLQLSFPSWFNSEITIIFATFLGHGIWTASPLFIQRGLRIPLQIQPKKIDFGEAGMQQFRIYVEQSLLALFIVQKGQIIYVNPYFAQLMEIPKEKLETWSFDTFLEHISLDDAVTVLEGISKDSNMNDGNGFFTYRIYTGEDLNPDTSKLKWVQHFSNKISYRGDTLVQNILLDITEQKNLEEKYKTSEIRQQKLESLALLAGGIAHDFNNLLNVIMGNLSLLRLLDDPAKSKEQIIKELNDYLTDLENATQLTVKLTNQLLTFSKGGAPIKKSTKIIDLIQQSVKLALSGSKAKYELQIDPNLPPVDVDSNQIIQVFNNILINADQSMPQGGTITIRAGLITIEESGQKMNNFGKVENTLQLGSYVMVSIQDTGVGIPKELIPRIFDPYFTTKPKGTGMGLTTCLSIIKRHGGTITFESEVNKGTTFDIFLPISTEKPESKPLIPKTELNMTGSILIMDDNEGILRALSRMIITLGFQVDVARNGHEAIEKYRNALNAKTPFSLIILDLIIPGDIGGKDTLIQIKKIHPEVKAIVSSGYSNDPIMGNYKDYGFVGVLAKPYSLDQLKLTLASHLQNKP